MNNTNGNDESEDAPPRIMESAPKVQTSNTDTLFDLLGTGDDLISAPPVTQTLHTSSIPQSNNLLDLLGDIDIPQQIMSTTIPQNDNNNFASIPSSLSIFDDNENTKIPTSISIQSFDLSDTNSLNLLNSTFNAAAPPSDSKIVTAMNKNDVHVQFAVSNINDGIQIFVTTTNNSDEKLDQYMFQVSVTLSPVLVNCVLTWKSSENSLQAAVPKSFQLKMLSPSGSILLPAGTITQELQIKRNTANVSGFSCLHKID